MNLIYSVQTEFFFFQFIFGLHNLIFASDINKNYDQLLGDIDSDRGMHFGCAKCTTIMTIAQETKQTISKSEMLRSHTRARSHTATISTATHRHYSAFQRPLLSIADMMLSNRHHYATVYRF